MHRNVAIVVYGGLGGKDHIEKTWKIRGDRVGQKAKIVPDKNLKIDILKAHGLDPKNYTIS